MLEYRGYGLSQGSPSEEGLYMDARAGIDYLFSRTDINTNEIIVFGRSLGIYIFDQLFLIKNICYMFIIFKYCYRWSCSY